MLNHYLKPDWPAPKNIIAYTTTREGGVSNTPYHSFNLAAHVGDNLESVIKNRAILKKDLNLPSDPIWLNQTHSTNVISLDNPITNLNADASFTTKPNTVCAVLTADCLPLLICTKTGTKVAAIHAGWQGLLNGIIESTINALEEDGNNLLVWLGPAISNKAFIVKDDVRDVFVEKNAEAKIAFTPVSNDINDSWHADLYLLARLRLTKYNITNIYGGTFCTYNEPKKFFSFRRDNGITGRMASIIFVN